MRPSSIAPAPGRDAAARPRLLIVDDDDLLRRALGRLLQRHADVVLAASGAEALALLRRDAAFDLVLCDVRMAGLSGYDVAKTLDAEAPALAARLVLMSGASDPGGAVRQVAKPIRVADIVALLR